MEFNPLDKKSEICELLDNRKIKYELHTSNDEDEEYEYLENNDLCITAINSYYDVKLYIDLEDEGEMTISFGEWHSHYYNDDESFNCFLDDLNGIFDNKKCTYIIKSTKRQLSSTLINNTEEESYKQKIKSFPEEFLKEIETIHGVVNLYYWNNFDNKEINV